MRVRAYTPRVCVTGVQRGPARDTEFKFQIWSVSQGVTVCIALPASSNSLHRWCVFVLFPPFPSFIPAAHSAQSSPFSRFRPVHISISAQSLLFLPFIYPSRFFILFKQERKLIDRSKEIFAFQECSNFKMSCQVFYLIPVFFLTSLSLS